MQTVDETVASSREGETPDEPSRARSESSSGVSGGRDAARAAYSASLRARLGRQGVTAELLIGPFVHSGSAGG